MKITGIKIINNKNFDDKKDKLLGTATIIFDYDFGIHDIRIMNGEKGEYLKFPKNEREQTIFCPTTNDMRMYILNSLLDELYKNK